MEHNHQHGKATAPEGTGSAKDPVCGMTVTTGSEARYVGFQDKTFHFCSEKCEARFKTDPWFYASGHASEHKHTTPGSVQPGYAR